MTPQLFVSLNTTFFVIGFVLAIIVLILAARHTWMVGYGPEQARIRFWMAIALILLTLLALSAAIFNLIFV
ncbi:MAG: hypothetical protein AAB538_01730 [Patescibacteria group bacterium]